MILIHYYARPYRKSHFELEDIVVGQRWINEAELSLGLGTLVGIDERTLRIDFAAIGETRTYARESAALSRALFEIGDRLRSRDGQEILVEGVVDSQGLVQYRGLLANGKSIQMHEMELSDFTQLNRANQRLFSGQIDKGQYYQLRQRARTLVDRVAHSSVRGLNSGRTSLIPHQLYIANEVANRQAPRVLLADEVGLGKTIEAGMILNTRVIRGEVSRILVLVPEALRNQWLVEMLRRFNLRFSLYDEARCRENEIDLTELVGLDDDAEIEVESTNPFELEQLVICSLPMFTENADLHQQALDAGWDMVFVDEAHHLQWTPELASPEYQVVESFAQLVPSVLLLTATPEQLGKEGHFARLRLLDSARFHDYQRYLTEEQGYIATADVLELLERDLAELAEADWVRIQQELDQPDLHELLAQIRESVKSGDTTIRQALNGQLIGKLLDRHGTGRLLFRNTRAAISGFPKRQAIGYSLPCPDAYQDAVLSQNNPAAWRQELTPEIGFQSRSTEPFWTKIDPRVSWLFDFVKAHAGQKVLVIAALADTAMDLAEEMRVRTGISPALFHEGMSIVERDRAAAYFADQDYGSQCLLCSEIGSEGRNFQFAHHLVLFDLPENPDLLEQRIGRLDRIGQTQTISIHVPYIEDSAQAMYFRFYSEALNAFDRTCVAAQSVLESVAEEWEQKLQQRQLDEEFIAGVSALRESIEQDLQAGRDRLLERNSCRMDEAMQLVSQVEAEDDYLDLQRFMQLFCDNSGVHYEIQTNDTVVIRPTESMTSALNGLPDEGMTITYDRERALAQEDLQFFTWDHPFVVSALDSILSSETGNTALVTLKVKGVRPGTLMLETVFAFESPSNKTLNIGRFLPASRIRVLLDASGRLLEQLPEALIDQNQQPVKRQIAARIAKAKRVEIQALLQKAATHSGKTSENMRKLALSKAQQQLEAEIQRLEYLQQVNPSVRDSEIQALKMRKSETLANLDSVELALDSIRVIVFT